MEFRYTFKNTQTGEQHRGTSAMKVRIEATYETSAVATLDLPEGKTWDDVKEYWIKWGTAVIEFEDGSKLEHELDAPGETDWKWPVRSVVLKDGDDFDYDDPLAEES